MIDFNESPENFLNKFLSQEEEGMRGILLARSQNKKQAIMLAANSSFDKSVQWGRMYLVKETNPKNYPIFVRRVSSVPVDFELTILNVLQDVHAIMEMKKNDIK